MPGKSKAYADEYESDDFEHTDTLIGRNRVPVNHTKKKTRPSSATKSRTPRRPVTPGKKKRPTSAKTGHELWMNAVKSRQTVGLSSNRHPQSPRHKTPSEYWIETLRRTGTGLSTESTGMNTFSGKRPRDKDMPYLSTPSYLRQKVGTERAGKGHDPMAKAAPGTPNYKSQEEYYEQILEYKKQMASMNQEASNMKAKIRRLEEDSLKKEKEIDGLLNPHKSEEVRRTLADKRPDSGTMVHSLKQKILKLETQLRDKEASYIKLQSDLKTTKIEELKQQLEVFYQEIVRLQNSRETGMDKSSRGMSKDGTVKIKALNETILRLNKSNEQLQNENRGLKDDLKNSMESHRDVSKDYEDMNKRELLRTISQLERRTEKAERYMDGSSIVSYDTKSHHVQGKIPLDGSLEDRLDQLDKRESELLALLAKKNEKIRLLTEEKNRWKRRSEDMENMQTTGQIDHHEHITDAKIEKSRQKSPSVTSRPPSSRPLSARRDRDRPVSARSESERPYSARDRSGSRSDRPLSGKSERSTRPPSATRRRSSIDSGVSSVRRKRIQDFKENRSAKTIQRNWRSHQDKRRIDNEKVQNFRENLAAKRIQKNWTKHQYRKHEHERDEASDMIRSALMGHSVRQRQMQQQFSDDDYEDTEDEEYNDCVNMIQSALKGHTARKTHMREYQFSSTGEDDYDDDDSVVIGSPRRNLSSSIRSNRPQSGRSRSSISNSKGSTIRSGTTYNKAHSSTFLDDDDDF